MGLTETNDDLQTNVNYVVYQEGIYVGYKYYETRYEDKVIGTGNAGDFTYGDSYPDALLLFGTPLQRDDELSDGPETSPYNAEGFALEDYRDAIVAVCEERNIEYIDFVALSCQSA